MALPIKNHTIKKLMFLVKLKKQMGLCITGPS
jgi:hypothetical protein